MTREEEATIGMKKRRVKAVREWNEEKKVMVHMMFLLVH